MSKTQKRILTCALICIIVAMCFVTHAAPDEFISRKELAALDVEFARYIGEDHIVTHSAYAFSGPCNDLDVGHGPLYAMRGCDLLVGATGTVGIIAYRQETNNAWRFSESPQEGTKPYIVVIEDFIAPEEWWNRSLAAYDVDFVMSTSTETSVASIMLLRLAPAEMSYEEFQNYLSNDATFAPDNIYWIWNGAEYVEAEIMDDSSASGATRLSQLTTLSRPSNMEGRFFFV